MTDPIERIQQGFMDGLDAGESNPRDPLEVVLSEFSEDIRKGNSPSIDDYASRYPELAVQIRDLFPLVHGLEQWKEDREIECLRRNVPAEFPLSKLGDYELIRELGRGGMGVVFQAVHSKSQRPVAIKLLPWRFAADMPVWRERLQCEAATIAALQHPNIVSIYSFSEDQGYPYYVMQLVEGIGLDKLIDQLKGQRRRAARRKRRIADPSNEALTFDSWRRFAGIGEQVALALAYAHENGVCHNDIKPSNLLVRSNRQVIVTDFGIGRLSASDVAEGDDRAIGTLKYMAPERLAGGGSHQSDLYSLGVTLYELTTQRTIFPHQKRKPMIDAILHEKPIAPHRFNPDFPRPLEKIILKAMAKDVVDRYASAKELALDLSRFINRQPIPWMNHSPWKKMLTACQNWVSQFRR